MVNYNNYKTIDDVFTYYNMNMSFNKCKLGKMWKNSIVDFNMNRDQYITFIIDKILANQYYFNPLRHTIINERGKERLLSTLTVQDRLVSKCLNNYFLLEYYRPRLIKENCATLKDRGTSYAIDILRRNMQSISSKHGLDFYILKMDIKSYFDSIPHNYCLNLVRHATYDEGIIHLFELIFKVNYYDGFIHHGEHAPYGIGLGGEIPQTFGVITLNELDHLIKERFKIKYYVRYMDDMILLHKDKEYLIYVLSECRKYLLDRLELYLNDKKTQIIQAKNGVIFLKMHFYPNENSGVFIKQAKSARHIEKRKLLKFKDMVDNGTILYTDIRNHYLAHRSHIDIVSDKRYLQDLDNYYDELFVEYYLQNGYFDF